MNKNLTKSENIIDALVKNRIVVFLIILAFLLIASVLTSLQKKQYSSTAQVLIIQEQGNKMDAYLASKASESVAKDLKEAIFTSSFRSKVLTSFTDSDLNLPHNEKDRRKTWLKTIDVKIIPNTSILELTTYHQSAFQAEKLLNKILSTLLENHQLYHGGGDSIRLKIINDPLTSIHPVKPNWFLNLFLSLVLALFFVITLLSLFPNKISVLNNKFKQKKHFSNQNANFKVFDHPHINTVHNYGLPADLFKEEGDLEIQKEEGFFNDAQKKDFSKEKESRQTITIKNNNEIKKIIGNNHYLRRKS